jgi:hypothetical protein
MLTGFFGFAVSFLPLVFAQRLLHRELQRLFYLLTRSRALAYGLFALVFLPGVFLHEVSHYLMARLLRVPVGGFSLLPEAAEDGMLRLGYVEAGESDPLRGTLIGAAPLLTGLAFLAWVGQRFALFDLFRSLLQGDWPRLWDGIRAWTQVPDFWLWFYLAVVVSSTMLPSASDRHAWRTFGLLAAVLLAAVVLLGGGERLLTLAGWLDDFFRSLTVLLLFSALVHSLVSVPIGLLRAGLSHLTGLHF